jgi:hypothetical protein
VLPNLRQVRVTPAEIQKILAAADQAGLLGPDANFNATDIFDASSTSFTTIVDGKTHTIGAYALGYPVVTVGAALTEARKKLSASRTRLGIWRPSWTERSATPGHMTPPRCGSSPARPICPIRT